MTVSVFFKVDVDFIINPGDTIDKYNDLCSHITGTYVGEGVFHSDVYTVNDNTGTVVVEFDNITDAIKADADVKAAIERFDFKVDPLDINY